MNTAGTLRGIWALLLEPHRRESQGRVRQRNRGAIKHFNKNLAITNEFANLIGFVIVFLSPIENDRERIALYSKR